MHCELKLLSKDNPTISILQLFTLHHYHAPVRNTLTYPRCPSTTLRQIPSLSSIHNVIYYLSSFLDPFHCFYIMHSPKSKQDTENIQPFIHHVRYMNIKNYNYMFNYYLHVLLKFLSAVTFNLPLINFSTN